MQIISILLIAASAVLAQQVGSTTGDTVSGGPVAISSPNINNGDQIKNSLVNSGVSGGNTFSGISNSAFNTAFSNQVSEGNNFVNSQKTEIKGNDGTTVSGQSNTVGSSFGPGYIPNLPINFLYPIPVVVAAPANYRKRNLIAVRAI
ncbi:hypothetical protein LPJ66_005952 [Kickxella alabastrina]|uniref:Uncharacterized protein n=1 Tax=Kickxella alabastrina TaxID=61397 RepID=A0ACC1ID41_9FUNG|nr:hypothetical protein LPJ66_005952 [Kickxella alabastrina]